MELNAGMAVNIDLNLPEEIAHIRSFRDINWLWAWLQHNIGGLDPTKFGSRQGKSEEIISALDRGGNRSVDLQVIRRCHAEMLLPEADIQWITKADQRLIDWISLTLFNTSVDDLYGPLTPETLMPNAVVLSWIDVTDQEIFTKKQVIKQLSDAWQNITAGDNQLKWISKTNQTQCQWAWDYLSEKGIGRFGLKQDPRKELYKQVLTRFDTWQSHPDTRTLLINNMRKSWSQKKFRDKNTDTKQYNFRLSVSTKDKLDTLAAARKKSLNQLLDEMITEEHERAIDKPPN